MSYKNLQGFIKKLEREGELIRVKEEVSPYLEVTEITNRIAKRYGPAILFENVIGSSYPVLMNTMGTKNRINMALGIQEGQDLEEEFERFLELSYATNFMSGIKSTSRFGKLAGILPIRLPIKGKCQEIVETNPDLRQLPIIQSWPQESGSFMQMAIAVLLNPKTGTQNMVMSPMQILGQNTIGISLGPDVQEIYEFYKKQGKKIPVSIILGCEPTITYGANVPLPKTIDPMILAGYLRKCPVAMVKSITHEIYIPSETEFVLEGYIDTDEVCYKGGVVGETTGYYSLEKEYAIMHITCMTHKKHPIYLETVVGQSKIEKAYINKNTEKMFLAYMRGMNTSIVDIDLPIEGIFNGCVIVSINKRFPGHAKQVMNMVWGMEQFRYTKVVIVVDKEIKPSAYEKVALKVLENMSPKEDIIYSAGPLSEHDYASPNAYYGYRLGIDATKKLDMEEGLSNWHQVEMLDEENFVVKDVLDGLIREMAVLQEGVFKGYTIASIRKQRPEDINKVCQYYWDQVQLQSKCFIIVDEMVDIYNASEVSWRIFNNIDAQRDVLRIADEAEQVKVIVDATKKGEMDGHYRQWPDTLEMSQMIKGAVTSKWEAYGIEKMLL